MVHLIAGTRGFERLPIRKLWDKDDDQVLAFMRGSLVFVFNFSPVNSYSDYGILAPQGEYRHLIDTDAQSYGGYNRIDPTVAHLTQPDPLYQADNLGWLKLYLPARTALVLEMKQ